MSHGLPISPLIEIRVVSRSPADNSKLTSALEAIAQNDPIISVKSDAENGEALVGGDSELDLERVFRQLKQLGLEIDIGAPQVSYRETITCSAAKDYTHKRIFRDVLEYARLIFEIEPTDRGVGNVIELNLSHGALPEALIAGIKKGLDSALANGPIVGFPIVDLKLSLTDAAFHQSDSSPIAFEVAARTAMRQAFESAGMVLLEPVMKVDVTLPAQFVGLVIHDLQSRRGQVDTTDDKDETFSIGAFVPLANMFGYQASLKALSADKGTFTMVYSHYKIVSPPSDPDNFRPAVGKRV